MSNEISTGNLFYSKFTHIKQDLTVNPSGSCSVKLCGLSVQFSSRQIRNPQSVFRLSLGESHEFD